MVLPGKGETQVCELAWLLAKQSRIIQIALSQQGICIR